MSVTRVRTPPEVLIRVRRRSKTAVHPGKCHLVCNGIMRPTDFTLGNSASNSLGEISNVRKLFISSDRNINISSSSSHFDKRYNYISAPFTLTSSSQLNSHVKQLEASIRLLAEHLVDIALEQCLCCDSIPLAALCITRQPNQVVLSSTAVTTADELLAWQQRVLQLWSSLVTSCPAGLSRQVQLQVVSQSLACFTQRYAARLEVETRPEQLHSIGLVGRLISKI
ncbi:unnamed protein product [Protopolystoma xenopodis]|uniref:Uncharacterized protein n=1 Tax=Protopolystoma xenopodis TaxID=117903 RepID=A0A448WGU1_9PLAT|nr:unnamed protein product [Protopolystoma xenopodis]